MHWMPEDTFIQDILISTKTQELDVGKNLIDPDWQKNNQLTLTLHDSQITKTLSKPLSIFSCAPYLGPPKPLWLILVSQSLTQPYDLKVNFMFFSGNKYPSTVVIETKGMNAISYQRRALT